MPKETLIQVLKRQGTAVVNDPQDIFYRERIIAELENATDFNAKEGAKTALMYACEFHNNLAVKWMFKKRGAFHKIHLNAHNSEETVLTYAVKFADNDEEKVDQTLKRKRNILQLLLLNFEKDPYGLKSSVTLMEVTLQYGNIRYLKK